MSLVCSRSFATTRFALNRWDGLASHEGHQTVQICLKYDRKRIDGHLESRLKKKMSMRRPIEKKSKNRHLLIDDAPQGLPGQVCNFTGRSSRF